MPGVRLTNVQFLEIKNEEDHINYWKHHISNTINIGLGKDIPMVISDKITIDIIFPNLDTYTNNKINLKIMKLNIIKN